MGFNGEKRWINSVLAPNLDKKIRISLLRWSQAFRLLVVIPFIPIHKNQFDVEVGIEDVVLVFDV